MTSERDDIAQLSERLHALNCDLQAFGHVTLTAQHRGSMFADAADALLRLQRERDQAYERAAKAAEDMRPEGGRAWSEGQLACWECLTDLAGHLRSLTKHEPV